MARIIKTDTDAYLSYAQLAALEQRPRSRHTLVDNILARSYSQALLKGTQKVEGTQPGGGSQFGQSNGPFQMFLDVGLNSADLPGRKTGTGFGRFCYGSGMLAQSQRNRRCNALQTEVVVGAGQFALVIKGTSAQEHDSDWRGARG